MYMELNYFTVNWFVKIGNLQFYKYKVYKSKKWALKFYEKHKFDHNKNELEVYKSDEKGYFDDVNDLIASPALKDFDDED